MITKNTNRMTDGGTVNVKDFGAVGDGVTDDTAAVVAMAADKGYAVFPEGDFLLSTQYIDFPIIFLTGAAITIPAGESVTIRSRIDASNKQQIFKGDGNIYFEVTSTADGRVGEDSKYSYAAWWGIFPMGQRDVIYTALLNKALGAYSTNGPNAQTREGIFEIDHGSYRIDGTITIPRGVHLKGAGTRRTVFDVIGNGYTAIEAGGEAVKVTGIQFEQAAGVNDLFEGTQISLPYDTPFVEDIRLLNCNIGIHIGPAANRAYVRKVTGTYAASGYNADSATVWVQGNNALIKDVRVTSTSNGPSNIVLVGYGNTTTLNNVTIQNIHCSEKSTPVKILSDDATIVNVIIDNVTWYSTSSGDNIDALVELETSNTGSIRNVIVSNACCNSIVGALLKATQGSSGTTDAITLASGAAYSSQTKAADLTQTAGTMSHIVIAHGVAAFAATTPVATSGTITSLEIPSYM